MKKILCVVLTLCALLSLTACGEKAQEISSDGFKPALDTGTSCDITVAGSYDNFEALEMEFDRFNEIYPNVKLSYVKLDDYNNVLGTALDSNDVSGASSTSLRTAKLPPMKPVKSPLTSPSKTAASPSEADPVSAKSSETKR